jgi:DNA-binding response OmpR family regulator
MANQKTVLIIEDDLPIAQAYSDKLERSGFKVSVAHDGQAGLTKALTGRLGRVKKTAKR